MFESPYQTSTCRQYKLDKVVSEVVIALSDQRGIIRDFDPVLIVGPLAENVPMFTQPLVQADFGDRKIQVPVILDGRSFYKKSTEQRGVQVSNNLTVQELMVNYGNLIWLWTQHPEMRADLWRAGELPGLVYMTWIGQTIAARLGLEMGMDRQVMAITALFYCHLFIGAEEALQPAMQQKLAAQIIRWTRQPADEVLQMVEQAPYMTCLKDYTDFVKERYSDNTRLAQLSPGIIIGLLSNSWFGFGAQELVAVAMEYPPAFLALIRAALNQKAYKKTMLSRITERMTRGGNDAAFIHSLNYLLQRITRD